MKRLYKQFDKRKVDIDSKIDPMEMTDLEKARIKRVVMANAKRKSHMPRNLSAAAAFLLASGIAFSAAFPALAAKLPLVGNLFEQFVENDNYVFEEYGTFSTKIGETIESNGIRVTVTEAVYDKESVTIAYTIEGDREFGTFPILEGDFLSEQLGDKNVNIAAPKYITKKISDTEYAGLFIYQLINGPKPDELKATWNGTSILDVWNVKHQYEGDWTFDLTLQAIEGEETRSFADAGIASEEDGISIALTKMTQTPISTTLYLREEVDVPVATDEFDEFRAVGFNYVVKDNLGNEYNNIQFMDVSHSSEFKNGVTSRPRLTIPLIHEGATSITITPYIEIYKFMNEVDEDMNSRPLELVKEPYALKSMEFDLK